MQEPKMSFVDDMMLNPGPGELRSEQTYLGFSGMTGH